jgi:sugar phosphate isomerase/epimerase
VGIHDLTISSAPPDRIRTLVDIRVLAAELNEAGRACADAGFVLSVHNHGHEFEIKADDGRYAHAALFAEADPDLVKVELDLGWARAGGADPATLLRMYGARAVHGHIKAFGGEKGPSGRWIQPVVGDDLLDWPALIALGQQVGVQKWIVDTDVRGVGMGTPVESLGGLRRSLEYLRGLDIIKEA